MGISILVYAKDKAQTRQSYDKNKQEQQVKTLFHQALNNLPSEKVKSHYLMLMQKANFVRFQAFSFQDPPAMYNLEEHYLAVNINSNDWNGSEKSIWCILVHENQHILQLENGRDTSIGNLPIEQQAEIVWDDEIDAFFAEVSFAEQKGFMATSYPEIATLISKEKVDLKSAVMISAFPKLMQVELYRPLWPYFPNIFQSRLPQQYREKFKVINTD
jgi:hypothetical protein